MTSQTFINDDVTNLFSIDDVGPILLTRVHLLVRCVSDEPETSRPEESRRVGFYSSSSLVLSLIHAQSQNKISDLTFV